MTEKELRSKAEEVVSFKRHLLIYLMVIAGLFAIDYYDNGHIESTYFAALGWGVGISLTTSASNPGGFSPLKKKWNVCENPKVKHLLF